MSSRQVVKALARQASKQQARLPVAARTLSGAASGGGQARKSWVPADEIVSFPFPAQYCSFHVFPAMFVEIFMFAAPPL